jgi:SAM-dependent methyltransferase
MDLYERALSSRRLWARDEQGRRFAVPIAGWTAARRPGDESVLERCAGATLDVGCGPGRLVAALTNTGVQALGVDVSAGAVTFARSLGASAVCRSVFDPLPGDGHWDHAILADGNIGIGIGIGISIGGDPGRSGVCHAPFVGLAADVLKG